MQAVYYLGISILHYARITCTVLTSSGWSLMIRLGRSSTVNSRMELDCIIELAVAAGVPVDALVKKRSRAEAGSKSGSALNGGDSRPKEQTMGASRLRRQARFSGGTGGSSNASEKSLEQSEELLLFPRMPEGLEGTIATAGSSTKVWDVLIVSEG